MSSQMHVGLDTQPLGEGGGVCAHIVAPNRESGKQNKEDIMECV